MFSVLGEPEFGTGFDANGSSESFELVTEENNGDGSTKQGTEGMCGIKTPALWSRIVNFR